MDVGLPHTMRRSRAADSARPRRTSSARSSASRRATRALVELERRKQALLYPSAWSVESIESIESIEALVVGLERQKPHHLRLQLVARRLVELECEVVGLSHEAFVWCGDRGLESHGAEAMIGRATEP